MNTTVEPNFAVPPGETLAETLETLGMMQAELAERMGRPLKSINEIVAGKGMITSDTALQLEKVMGVPASFWMIHERIYLAKPQNPVFQRLRGFDTLRP